MSAFDTLASNTYPGRGIILGMHDEDTAVAAYFIMGRSNNSRNRIFVTAPDGGIRTQAYDESRLEDPSLIIYNAVRVLGPQTIVTNGDQTDTVFSGLLKGLSLSRSLDSRTFEPDAPNWTPRISGVWSNAERYYCLSIIKRTADGTRSEQSFSYEPVPGVGHLIHTYLGDGHPLPSYQGEPVRVAIEGSIDAFTASLWESLDGDNRVSLWTRFINIETGEYEERIVNKNE